MPVDKLANMEEKLWILEDLNMMYIRQIALSLQVTLLSSLALVGVFCFCFCFCNIYIYCASFVCSAPTSGLSNGCGVRETDLADFSQVLC